MKYFYFHLEQLRILKVIKTEVTLKEAAKRLYISQPALSLQIRKLEYEINSPILDRTQQQIRFTITGELVLDYAEKILGLCEEADKAIECLKSFQKTNLKIGSNETVGTYILPRIIDLFCKRYSHAHLKLEIGCPSNLAWNVANGKLNIGIIGKEEIPEELNGILKITPYFKEEVVLILPKTHKLTNTNSISLKDLYDLSFITLKPSLLERKFADIILKHSNIQTHRLQIKFELNSIEAIKRAVQAGLGVSFISKLIVKDELSSDRLRMLRINHKKLNKYLTLVVNPKVYQSSLSKKFCKHCFYILKIGSYEKFLNLDS